MAWDQDRGYDDDEWANALDDEQSEDETCGLEPSDGDMFEMAFEDEHELYGERSRRLRGAASSQLHLYTDR